MASSTTNGCTATATSTVKEGPSHCTWSLNSSSKSPHTSIPIKRDWKIMNTILDNIGNTPLVKINNITAKEGIKCELCKYLIIESITVIIIIIP